MHRWFIGFGLTVLLAAPNAVPASADLRKLDARARSAFETLRSGKVPGQARLRVEALDESGRLDAFVTGPIRRDELEAAGAIVRTTLPGVHTVRIPASAVERVAALAGVTGILGSVPVEPELSQSIPATGVSVLRGDGPTFPGLNGQGVIIGVVDGGVDYDHPDFRKPDGTTRFVSIWDQTHATGAPPAGFGYGTEFSPTEIDMGLPNVTDYGGHGTFVLGVAAGDGSSSGWGVPAHTYAGVAPRADLVFVNTNFSSTNVVDGAAYVFQRAAALGRPAIVNLSLGTQFGPHDGTSGFESALSALAGPGRIIAKSAGNVRLEKRHADALVGAGDSLITFACSNSSPGTVVSLEGYYESTDDLTVRITTPSGTVVGPVSLGNQNAGYPGVSTPNGDVWLVNGVNGTSEGDPQLAIQLNIGGGQDMNGTWTIHFTPVSLGAGNGSVDIWKGFNSGGIFDFVVGESQRELISEPGNATGVITVAAWTTRSTWTDCNDQEGVAFPDVTPVGTLGAFSSPGPTRDGRQKPEIAAPGTAIISTCSSDAFSNCPSAPSQMIGDSLQHRADEGTSFAAPHVAGVLALWMQKVGPVTPAQARTFLASRAVVDGFTGATWNQDWGAGKLNVGDLTDPDVTVTFPNGGDQYSIGSPAGIGWSAEDAGGVPTVDLLLSRHGFGGPWEPIAFATPNDGVYSWTVTAPPSDSAVVRVVTNDPSGNTGLDVSDALFKIWNGPPPTAVGDDAPRTLALGRPAPNPSRDGAEVSFDLPAGGRAQLVVLDVQGRRVASLWDGELAAGSHRVRWDGRIAGARAPLGLYFLRLDALGERRTRRLAIAR